VQARNHLPQCQAAVAEAILNPGLKLGSSPTLTRYDEYRVVAKAVAATGCERDMALPSALTNYRGRVIRVAQPGHHALETGAALRRRQNRSIP
jgi:hypothetical protein